MRILLILLAIPVLIGCAASKTSIAPQTGIIKPSESQKAFEEPKDTTEYYVIIGTVEKPTSPVLTIPYDSAQRLNHRAIATGEIIYNAGPYTPYQLPAIVPPKKEKPKLFVPESRNKGFWIKQPVIVAAAMYAGFRRHQRDVISEYYVGGYLRVHPNTNQQWSNPQLSSNNKYVDGDRSKGRVKLIGNINKPVAFSDLYHFQTFEIRLCWTMSLGLSMSLWKKPNWKQIIGQCLLVAAADIAGNGISTLVYDY